MSENCQQPHHILATILSQRKTLHFDNGEVIVECKLSNIAFLMRKSSTFSQGKGMIVIICVQIFRREGKNTALIQCCLDFLKQLTQIPNVALTKM